MSRLTRDGTVEPVSRDQILRRERGYDREIFNFPVQLTTQEWQPYLVDPYSCLAVCDTIHTDAGTFNMPTSYQ